MKYAVLVPGSNNWEWREGKVDYELISAFIGGPIELVAIDTPCTMYCHEEGKFLGLGRVANWWHDGHIWDKIVGNLILFGPSDKHGYETELTPEILWEVQKIIKPLSGD